MSWKILNGVAATNISINSCSKFRTETFGVHESPLTIQKELWSDATLDVLMPRVLDAALANRASSRRETEKESTTLGNSFTAHDKPAACPFINSAQRQHDIMFSLLRSTVPIGDVWRGKKHRGFELVFVLLQQGSMLAPADIPAVPKTHRKPY